MANRIEKKFFHHRTFNLRFMVLLVGLFQSSGVFAEEVWIQATLGEKTTSFRIQPEGKDFILNVGSTRRAQKVFKIGKKNYEFVLESVTQVIRLAEKHSASSPSTSCNRDQAEVEIVKESGKKLKSRFCLLSETPQSKALLDLLKVLGMSTI